MRPPLIFAKARIREDLWLVVQKQRRLYLKSNMLFREDATQGGCSGLSKDLQGQGGFSFEGRAPRFSSACADGFDAVFCAFRNQAALEVNDSFENMVSDRPPLWAELTFQRYLRPLTT